MQEQGQYCGEYAYAFDGGIFDVLKTKIKPGGENKKVVFHLMSGLMIRAL